MIFINTRKKINEYDVVKEIILRRILLFISFSDIPKMIPPMTPQSVAIVKALPFTHPLIFSFVIFAILELFF